MKKSARSAGWRTEGEDLESGDARRQESGEENELLKWWGRPFASALSTALEKHLDGGDQHGIVDLGGIPND